jgi:alpha-beta hydrolase superfamily lysophospholipase
MRRFPRWCFFDGLDITKELQYFHGVPELARRGLATLIVDIPGTGESIRFRGMPARYDTNVVGTAVVDYLETRSDVDKERIGVMGISLGGYYSPRAAAFEPRFKACVSWGAIWDYYAVWKRRVDKAGFALGAGRSHHVGARRLQSGCGAREAEGLAAGGRR